MNLVRLKPMTENAQLVVTLSCPDRPGIVHAVTGVIGESGGNVIQSQQFGDSDTGTFFMRVEVDSRRDDHRRGLGSRRRRVQCRLSRR